MSLSVCIVTSSYPRFEQDGNARFVRSIAEAQAALSHTVHVLAPYAPQVCSYPSPVQLHWFRYVWLAQSGVMGHAGALENDRRLKRSAYWLAPLYFVAQSVALAKIVRRYRIDLIHAHWVVPNGVSAALVSRWTNKPLVVSLHGSDVYLSMRSAWLGRLARWVFQRARAVTACSPELAEGAVRVGADRQRIHLVPWGASPEVFTDRADEGHLRDRLGIPRDAPIVLGLGRLVSKKGFANLIQSAPRVLAKYPETWFIIVGDGPERERLVSQANRLGVSNRVILPGPVRWNEVPEYLRMSSMFVVPSVRDVSGNMDGLPTTALEAMAAGRPVIGTAVGGIPLVVEHDQTGLIVPEADSEALTGAIIKLLSSVDERQRMGRAGRERVERYLNWGAVARQFDELYNLTLAP